MRGQHDRGSRGQRLASGDGKGTIRIWNLETGEILATLAAHDGEVRALAFSPEGDRLASGGQFHHLKLWDSGTWQQLNAVDVFFGALAQCGERLIYGEELAA